MSSFNEVDLTKGSISKHLISQSTPLLIGNLLYVGYNVINTLWVGNLLGSKEVAATAVSFLIVFVLISITNGATSATSILVSRYYGAKDMKMVEKVVNTSYSLFSVLGVVIITAFIIFSDIPLKLMNTEGDILKIASPYLKLSIISFFFMMLFIVLMSVLRGIGNTLTPMLVLVLSTVINAILDPILISGFGPFPKMGINGAAVATIVAQSLALIFGFIYTYRKTPSVSFHLKEFSFDKRILYQIIKIGFPATIQQSLIAISSTFVASIVNVFGPDATAAYGIAIRIDSVAVLPSMSIGMAVTNLCSQNLGANKPERVTELRKSGILLSLLVNAIIVIPCFIFAKNIISAFISEPNVVSIGSEYLRIMCIGYSLFGIVYICNGILNGAERTLYTMIYTLLCLWVIRVPFASILSKSHLGLTGIWISIVVSIAVTAIISSILCFLDKWKKSYACSTTHLMK